MIYGAGKTPGQIAGIVEAMKKRGQETILITRVDEEKSRETEQLPVGIQLRETQIIVSCCCKRLFLQLQNSVIHRQLSRRYFFQHFPYIFHV